MYCVVGALYIKEISFLELIFPYWRVNVVWITVSFLLAMLLQVDERIFSFFIQSNLLISSRIREVTVVMWGVYVGKLMTVFKQSYVHLITYLPTHST